MKHGRRFLKLLSFISLAMLMGGSQATQAGWGQLEGWMSQQTHVQPSVVGSGTFVELARRSVPSVVNISSLTTQKAPSHGTPDDLFRDFFNSLFDFQHSDNAAEGTVAVPRGRVRIISLGSGFVIDRDGIILTNNHVVEHAEDIKIGFTESPDDVPLTGTVIGRDLELDAALIRVQTPRKLVPLPLGDSDKLQVGEFVMAIGNPFGQGHSVTHGIVSATGRLAPDFPLMTYIQTDAPINPGNSGGPLINMRGEVIGINNAIVEQAHGIGFAIPINEVKRNLDQLKTKGYIERGYIGIVVADMNPDTARRLRVPFRRHPFVSSVVHGEPADRAGVQSDDIILEVNGEPVHSASDLIAKITQAKVAQTIRLKVRRMGRELMIPIQVEARPVEPS